MIGLEGIARAAVLEVDDEPVRGEAGTEATEDRIDQADSHAVLVDHGDVDHVLGAASVSGAAAECPILDLLGFQWGQLKMQSKVVFSLFWNQLEHVLSLRNLRPPFPFAFAR